MGEIITVVGGSDQSIAVTLDGSKAVELAKKISADLGNLYVQNKLLSEQLSTGVSAGDKVVEGLITEGGSYTINNGYDYVIVGGLNSVPLDYQGTFPFGNYPDNYDINLLNQEVTLNSAMKAGQHVTIVAGGNKNTIYNAGGESGKFIGGNVNNSIYFNGNTLNGGSWEIATGLGNDTIIGGAGDDTIYASGGKNQITLGNGNNKVYSEGVDTITSPDNGGFNTIYLNTIAGGNSKDVHATVNLGAQSLVIDSASYNMITVGGGSTVSGGQNSNVVFSGVGSHGASSAQGLNDSTITASTADQLNVIYGEDNTINAEGNLIFLNGTGDTNVTLGGADNSQIFGSKGLNFKLTANSDSGKENLFVAGMGNETLDGSSSSAGLLVYAYNHADGNTDNTNFKAVAGAGNDTMVSGSGNATFTGGAGDNKFWFVKGDVGEGTTVITDFAASSKNQITLFNYGFTLNDLNNILKNAKTDSNGNTTLDVEGRKIVLQGVTTDQLNASQFVVANYNTNK